MVHDVVSRGGRCLIPVFAVGPAQELMLILDEYWEAHPELAEIPIYCKYFESKLGLVAKMNSNLTQKNYSNH